MKYFLTLTLIAASFGFVACSEAKDVKTDKEVEKIVAEYIKNNGKALVDAINAHYQAEQMAALAGAVRDFNPVSGPEDAKVTVVEFSEYQCPFCRRVQGTMTQLRDKYESQGVKFVFKNFPLSFHPEATPAGIAAYAAHKQGKFWEYSDVLWENQGRLGEKLYMETAEKVGLDINQFNADRLSDEVKGYMTTDEEDGQKAGVQGTPFFIINGQTLSGAQPYEAFEAAIEAALKDAK